MELSLNTCLTCETLNGARELEVSIKAIYSCISFTFVNVSAIHGDWIKLIFCDFQYDAVVAASKLYRFVLLNESNRAHRSLAYTLI